MICNDVQKLIDYAIKKELITNDDIYVVRNQLMEALKLTDWESNNTEYCKFSQYHVYHQAAVHQFKALKNRPYDFPPMRIFFHTQYPVSDVLAG